MQSITSSVATSLTWKHFVHQQLTFPPPPADVLFQHKQQIISSKIDFECNRATRRVLFRSLLYLSSSKSRQVRWWESLRVTWHSATWASGFNTKPNSFPSNQWRSGGAKKGGSSPVTEVNTDGMSCNVPVKLFSCPSTPGSSVRLHLPGWSSVELLVQ